MPSSKTERDMQSFLRKLNYISIFISNLPPKAEPIFKLLKKNNTAKWAKACQEAFEKIKQYLSSPPVLVPLAMGRPLILYMAIQQSSMGCVLRQHDNTGRKERAIYYLSKKFNECKSRMDPIKYVFESPFIPGIIAKWQVILSQHNIVYMTRKVVKGSVIVDLLAKNPIDDYEALDFEFPNEHINAISSDAEGQDDVWEMYFGRAINLSGNGIGAVLITPDGKYFSIAIRLKFDCTNNVVEYEACISGLQAAIELKIRKLEVYGDSALIIYQVKGE
ncbi:uncharacterized protein LOC131178343 [Hevea brasiliensis]|uniref:uncharacterized protein LOC131178343 n=1 Tax=Hevea brasiliensis TaxID=3981 RepID=UPI0025D84B49|nr:uncharacterized protein LOC131178343 [Hevea brasiliensis]